MNKLNFQIIVFVITIFQSCIAQTTPKKEIYNADFKWSITIPEGFESVSTEEWTKLQNKGADAIEKTFDEEVVNQSKTIFVFKNDDFNYFESSYQGYDILIDGDYLESCKAVNNVLIETFKTQMPGVKIDTSSYVEKIDGLEFQTFKMDVEYPNNVVLHILMFSRLFGEKEFSTNIMYIDLEKGKKMIENWRSSKFKK